MSAAKSTPVKVTIYVCGGFGYTKVEATEFSSELGPCAQYKSAVKYQYKPKGKRKLLAYVQGYQPSLLVLDGWGHPDPASAMTTPVLSENGFMVSQSRHLSFDPAYAAEFSSMINAYIAEKGVTVVADYRGHNSHGAVAPSAA
jgi:hypothetical protein